MAPPRLLFHCLVQVADFIESEYAGTNIRRFLSDWDRSSAAESACFCDYWILSIRDYRDTQGGDRLSAKPVLLPSEGVPLANPIHDFDRRIGYHFVWYFHMLTRRQDVSYKLDEAVYADLRDDYDYLSARDAAVPRDYSIARLDAKIEHLRQQTHVFIDTDEQLQDTLERHLGAARQRHRHRPTPAPFNSSVNRCSCPRRCRPSSGVPCLPQLQFGSSVNKKPPLPPPKLDFLGNRVSTALPNLRCRRLKAGSTPLRFTAQLSSRRKPQLCLWAIRHCPLEVDLPVRDLNRIRTQQLAQSLEEFVCGSYPPILAHQQATTGLGTLVVDIDR